jgi:hypothetical protein
MVEEVTKRSHLDFGAIFAEFVEATKKDWGTSREWTVGASEVFDCERKVWFAKKGFGAGYSKDEDGDNWGAATRGNIMETHYIVPAILNHLPDGAKLLFAGEEQASLKLGPNSATPDGLITGLKRDALKDYGVPDLGSDDACVVIEFKTIDPRVSLRDAREKNIGQAQVQMGMFRELTEYKPDYAIVLYVDASFFDKIKVFAFKFEPYIWEVAKKRAAHIFKADKAEEMTPEGMIDKKSCEHCEWSQACLTLILGSIPEKDKDKKLPPEQEEIMIGLINNFYDISQEHKVLAAALERSKMDVREFLVDVGKRGVKTKGGTVSWYTMSRSGLDKRAMEEDGIDLERYKTMGSPFEVLRITPE